MRKPDLQKKASKFPWQCLSAWRSCWKYIAGCIPLCANNADFQDKDGILLLEVEAPGNVEHIDVNAVLQEKSIYPHEQEILFAPFVMLDKEPLKITEEEMLYKDINGDPPKSKYLLHLRGSSIVPCEIDENKKELKELYTKIMDVKVLNTAKQIWEMLMNGGEPDCNTTQVYVEWKEKLQKYLRMSFAGIKYKIAYTIIDER